MEHNNRPEVKAKRAKHRREQRKKARLTKK